MTQPTQHPLIQQQRKALQEFVQATAARATADVQLDQPRIVAERYYQDVKQRLAATMAEVQALSKLTPTGQVIVKTVSVPDFAIPSAVIGNDPMTMFQQCANEANRLGIQLKNLFHSFEMSRLLLSDSIAIELVQVPAGKFLYGEQKEQVELPVYFIGKTPVTTGQFLVFLKATGHRADPYWSGNLAGKLNYPAIFVNWDDAQAFCVWASQISRREVRLPSEKEWEKAARGTDGRIYPWGDNKPTKQLAAYSGYFRWESPGIQPVGSYTPKGDSPYGCQDMAGNVWEWCADFYGEDADGRVVRGGAFSRGEGLLPCASRQSYYPSSRLIDHGFRLIAFPIS